MNNGTSKELSFRRRRKAGMLLLACAGIFIFAASCSKKNVSETVGFSPENPVEIRFWYAFTGKIQECNLKMAELFNETRGREIGVRVIPEYQGDYAAVHQKLQASWVAGNAPEVSVIEIASMGGFAKNGVIMPLDDHIKQHNVDMKDFQAGLMGNSYIDGKTFGFPYLRSTPIMYMNTTLLAKAGLDTKGPSTWDEFEMYCRTLREKLGIYGASMHSYIWTFEGFMIQAGTQVINDEETECLIDSTAARDMAKFFQQLIKEDLIRVYPGADGSKITADIMSQNAAMWFMSTANMTTNLGIAKENGFELNTCFMPKKVRYGTPTGGCNVVVVNLKDKDRREAAWEFIHWLTDTEQTALASSLTGYMPSRHSAISSSKIQELYRVQPQFKVAVDQLAYASKRPINPNYSEGSRLIIQAMDAVWINNEDVDTVFPEIARRVTEVLQQK